MKDKIILHTNLQSDLALKLRTINRIYFEVNTCLNAFHLIRTYYYADEVELPNYLKFMGFLNFKNVVIELSKLLVNSKNEKYNLYKFVEDLKLSSYFVDVDKINELINILVEDTKEFLPKLKLARDKVYAHTDEDHLEITKVFVKSEMDPILKIMDEIIDTLNDYLKINNIYRFNIHPSLGENEFYKNVFDKIILK